jgi:hypothetical protein
VLNGGDGAWKQPQQTILFSLYADFVDAVVTLDGYNEKLMIQPGVVSRFELPGNNFLDANPLAAQDGFGEVVVSWMAGRIAAWIQSSFLETPTAPICWSRACRSSPPRPTRQRPSCSGR